MNVLFLPTSPPAPISLAYRIINTYTKKLSSMNKEIEFVALAHSLFLKQGVGREELQVHKNKAASC